MNCFGFSRPPQQQASILTFHSFSILRPRTLQRTLFVYHAPHVDPPLGGDVDNVLQIDYTVMFQLVLEENNLSLHSFSVLLRAELLCLKIAFIL